jgi:uncharacterized protein
MPYDPLPDLAGLTLEEIAALGIARKLPPVEAWNPEKSDDSEMRIAQDGRWYHQGGEITRPAMIRAFSSLLRRDGDDYFLVTPQEKLSIIVEDAPFIAVELDSRGDGKDRNITLRLNSDDIVVIGKDNAIEMRGILPYIHVRGGLFAKLSRPVYYELAALALSQNPDDPGIWSNGSYFSLTASA